MASLWRSAFRKILLIIEIARTRSRLQLMNIACNSPRYQSSLLPGYEPTGHSDIFGHIAIQECSRSDDSDHEGCYANPLKVPIINCNSLSWDQVFTHSGETCQKSIKGTHKWAMDEAAPTDVSLGNTTLFNRSQIRKTRYSLQPILASLGIEHAKSEFGSSQRSVVMQPCSTVRRTSQNLNRTGDIEAFICRPAGRASLKLLNLRGDSNDDPVSPMQTSPNQNSSDFEPPDTSPKPVLDCSESNFWLESKLASETVYELSQPPRRSSLTPLAWKAKIKIDQSCGKLPERFVSRRVGPQNDSSITQEYFPPSMTSTRRSLGQIRVPGPKDSSGDSRRRSSGCMAENGIYYRRHLAPDINARRAMLMDRPKKGLHTSRRRDASAIIPEGFATYEKDKDPGIGSDCSNFFSSSPQDLFVSVAAEESNSAFEDEISSASVHLRTSIVHRKSIDSGKLFSKCDASRRIRHSSESLLFDTLSLTVMSP